jgi:enoyl-[acyl-carrier protein] reductase I
MGLMEGKRGVILGVANDLSIAWGIAQQLHAEGAEIAFTYLNEAMEKRVRPLAESLGAKIILPCDVAVDGEMEAVFETLGKEWGNIDFAVHAIAFANREDLKHGFSQTSRGGFALALDISAYSLVNMTRCAIPLMDAGGSILTLTYLGAERVIPNYNVMAWPRRHWKPRSVTWPPSSALRGFGSMAFRPVRSRPWPRRGSPISGKSSR